MGPLSLNVPEHTGSEGDVTLSARSHDLHVGPASGGEEVRMVGRERSTSARVWEGEDGEAEGGRPRMEGQGWEAQNGRARMGGREWKGEDGRPRMGGRAREWGWGRVQATLGRF